MNPIPAFIKYQRKTIGLTQQALATKAGVGLRFIRELESGKETLQMDKVFQVLSLFGFELIPVKQQMDAYDIYWNYINKPVTITLTNNLSKYGVIIKELIDPKLHKIYAWQFVPITNIMKYNKKPNDNLMEIILHADISQIEIN